jgi:hypothetical protein
MGFNLILMWFIRKLKYPIIYDWGLVNWCSMLTHMDNTFDLFCCDISFAVTSCYSIVYNLSRRLVDCSFQHQKMAFASVGKNLLLRRFALYLKLWACSFNYGDVDLLDYYLGSFASVISPLDDRRSVSLEKLSLAYFSVGWQLKFATYILFLASWMFSLIIPLFLGGIDFFSLSLFWQCTLLHCFTEKRDCRLLLLWS